MLVDRFVGKVAGINSRVEMYLGPKSSSAFWTNGSILRVLNRFEDSGDMIDFQVVSEHESQLRLLVDFFVCLFGFF